MRGFVHPSVGPSVRWSISPSGVIKLKSGKTSILDTYCVRLSVGVGLMCGWGFDAPAHTCTTILWPRVTCFETMKWKFSKVQQGNSCVLQFTITHIGKYKFLPSFLLPYLLSLFPSLPALPSYLPFLPANPPSFLSLLPSFRLSFILSLFPSFLKMTNFTSETIFL